jgi:hypothetical protein
MIKVKGKEVELHMDWFTMTKLDKEFGIKLNNLAELENSPVLQTDVLIALMPKDVTLTFEEACEVFNENGPVKVVSELSDVIIKYFGEDLQGETKA